jgi:hypothetical protein
MIGMMRLNSLINISRNDSYFSLQKCSGIHHQRGKENRDRSLSPRSREAGNSSCTTLLYHPSVGINTCFFFVFFLRPRDMGLAGNPQRQYMLFEYNNLFINILSYGYSYGYPAALMRAAGACSRLGYISRTTLLHKIMDMHCIKHKLVKNTLPSHNVKHDDTRVPSNCRRAEK